MSQQKRQGTLPVLATGAPVADGKKSPRRFFFRTIVTSILPMTSAPMTSVSSTSSPLEGAALTAVPHPVAGEESLEHARINATEMGSYAADLKRRAMSLTRGDVSRASDLVQDTFERAISNLHRVVPGSNVRAWLYTIMVRRFRDTLRQDRVRQAAPYQDNLDLPAEDAEPLPRWHALTSEQIRSALVQLNPELRAAFERREFGQQSYQRIADDLGIPVATVGTRLMRARQRLREILVCRLEQIDAGDAE